MPRPLPTSKLLAHRWDLDGAGRVRLVIPSAARLQEVDDAWPAGRAPTDAHRHWRWATLAAKAVERFAILDEAGRTAAVWCSAKRETRLEGRRYYRLDYLEVRPDLRGGAAGAFTLALTGTRAAELGCQGLVLAAFLPLTGFYARAGGVQRLPPGWTIEKGLVPFVFEGPAFENFQRVTDAFRADEE